MDPFSGILLHGPPGTGKTLIARQIGKMLNAREPKIVNGPEILSKFVGASEENIRKLFADAEKEVCCSVIFENQPLKGAIDISTRRKKMKAGCTLLFSMNWTLYSSSEDRPTMEPELVTVLSTNFSPK